MGFAMLLLEPVVSRTPPVPEFWSGGPHLSVVNAITPHLRRRGKLVARALVLPVAFLLVMAPAAPTVAKLVRDKDAATLAPREVFGDIARAWEEGDEQALAALIHEDGLRVTNSQAGKRVSNYSPSQAYYFFRNLFQSHRTLLFEFEMMQDATAGARVHGMATWKRRRPDSEKIQSIKLVCILIQQDDLWKLAEINTIR